MTSIKSMFDEKEAPFPKVPGLNPAAFERIYKESGYRARNVLGNGEFGKVVRATRTKKDDPNGWPEEFAIKVVLASKARKKTTEIGGQPREYACSILINHDNCLKIFDVIYYSKAYFYVMHYCPRGNVVQYLESLKNHALPDEDLMVKWIRQILSAVVYLHNTLKMAHRNICLSNLFLEHNLDVKLGGYGSLKCEGSRVEMAVNQTKCTTRPYQAPEVYKNLPHDPFKADVWSFGVLLYVINTRKLPFMTAGDQVIYPTNQDTLYKTIVRNIKFLEVDEVLRQTFIISPEKRPYIDIIGKLNLFKPNFGKGSV